MSYVAGSMLAPGTTVAGYRIEALIGRGGMGAVYRASEEGLGRKVALKVIARLGQRASRSVIGLTPSGLVPN